MTVALTGIALVCLLLLAACLCDAASRADERIDEAVTWMELDEILADNHIDRPKQHIQNNP